MSKIELYYHPVSPPCRAVAVLLSMLKLPHELKIVDLLNKGQFQPEVVQINPQHSIPILIDNGTVIIDSHVINTYLVGMYGNYADTKLYPRDLVARAEVDRMLHYDTGVLFPTLQRVKRAYVPNREITGVTPAIVAQFDDIYNAVEGFLKRSTYIAGDDYTIADISVYISLTIMREIWLPETSKFPLITAYFNRCETNIPYLKKINDPGVEGWRKLMNGFKTTL